MTTTPRGRAVRRGAAIVAVAALASVGCSRDDDPTSTVGARSDTTTAGDLDTALARGEFGTIDDIGCGPTPEGETLAATASQGVTADTIEIGTIADPGASFAPGLGQEMFDAADVFVEWCNSLGGINGRRINLNKRDAALFNYQAVMVQACGNDFALVGGGSTSDATGERDRLSCGLPNVPSFVASPEARGSDLTFVTDPLPADAMTFSMPRWLAEQYPGSEDNVGFLSVNLPVAVQSSDQLQEAGEGTGGWTVTYDELFNTSEPTYQPYAERIRDAGVRGLVYVGPVQTLPLLLQELTNIGYELDWITGNVQLYDQLLIEEAGAALDSTPVYTWTTSLAFEQVEEFPVMEQYRSLFETYLPEGAWAASLALKGFGGWLLFAQAADACGVDLTRSCLYDNLRRTTEWDMGGLQAPTNPGEYLPGGCFQVVRALPDGFVIEEFDGEIEANIGPFNCDPANVAQLDPSWAEMSLTLEALGLSLDDIE